MSETKIKRFYKAVHVVPVDGMHHIRLDERSARTAGGELLASPEEALATAIAEEWDAQAEAITLSSMPLTRLQGFALDGGEAGYAEWQSVIEQYAQSDLLCYRAPDAKLSARQAACWQPVLSRVEARLGEAFAVTEGVIAVRQPPELIDSLRAELKTLTQGETLAAKILTEMLGSACLAMALVWGEISADDAYAFSRLDETHQQEIWGTDEEAAERDRKIKAEFDIVVRFLALSGGSAEACD